MVIGHARGNDGEFAAKVQSKQRYRQESSDWDGLRILELVNITLKLFDVFLKLPVLPKFVTKGINECLNG